MAQHLVCFVNFTGCMGEVGDIVDGVSIDWLVCMGARLVVVPATSLVFSRVASPGCQVKTFFSYRFLNTDFFFCPEIIYLTFFFQDFHFFYTNDQVVEIFFSDPAGMIVLLCCYSIWSGWVSHQSFCALT